MKPLLSIEGLTVELSTRDRTFEAMYLWNDALTGHNYASIDQVSRTIVLYDGQTTRTDSDPSDGPFAAQLDREQCSCLGLPDPPGLPDLRPRHNEGWNVAYADGHVKWTNRCGEGDLNGPSRLPW